jgi:hypothetical protein
MFSKPVTILNFQLSLTLALLFQSRLAYIIFRGPLQKFPTKSLDGLSSKTEVLDMGTVQDFYGVKMTITTMAYYVPTANIRLLSPKVYFYEQNGGSYHMERGMTRLTIGDG